MLEFILSNNVEILVPALRGHEFHDNVISMYRNLSKHVNDSILFIKYLGDKKIKFVYMLEDKIN